MNSEWHQIEAALTIHQKFRLVEIAHESTDADVKRAAMDVLACAMSPLRVVKLSNEEVTAV